MSEDRSIIPGPRRAIYKQFFDPPSTIRFPPHLSVFSSSQHHYNEEILAALVEEPGIGREEGE